ncbi:MAG: phosphoribosylformylglycinamidine cyclo-ligase, partial [Candidatus Helarchaeota archaeon]|nr:phosphoribosylformylglycinamidine cyclo-ligase [Candidatus Helarchaeota archaeon]
TKGAKPLFFMDYISSGRLKSDVIEQIITGIVRGCDEAECSLIGGETAEMPDFYKENEYDLAGFIVGAVEINKIIDGKKVKTGDKIIGLKSSGLHSNGFSLVRKLFFEQLEMKVDSFIPELGKTLGEELLTPTKIYSKQILNIIGKYGEDIHGMAHITGGGFLNIRRINEQKGYVIDRLPEIPLIFNLTQEKGNITDYEMFKTFNMGVGFVIVTDQSEKIIEELKPNAEIIGYIDDSRKIQIKERNIIY